MARMFAAGFIVVAGLAVTAADYTTQARAAGVAPFALSMSGYADTLKPRFQAARESMQALRETQDNSQDIAATDVDTPQVDAPVASRDVPDAPEMPDAEAGIEGAKSLLASLFSGSDASPVDDKGVAQEPKAQPVMPKRLQLSGSSNCRSGSSGKFCSVLP